MDDRTNIPDDVKMVDKLNKNDKTKSSVKNEEETEDPLQASLMKLLSKSELYSKILQKKMNNPADKSKNDPISPPAAPKKEVKTTEPPQPPATKASRSTRATKSKGASPKPPAEQRKSSRQAGKFAEHDRIKREAEMRKEAHLAKQKRVLRERLKQREADGEVIIRRSSRKRPVVITDDEEEEDKNADLPSDDATEVESDGGTVRHLNKRQKVQYKDDLESDEEENENESKARRNENDDNDKGRETFIISSSEGEDEEDEEDEDEKITHYPGQPALVSGTELRDFQKAGVEWLSTLDSNGFSGILADEMGLGKTLQTITFLAQLIEDGNKGPFLIICPLSVVKNWIKEFNKFTPKLEPIMYHGDANKRKKIRQDMKKRGFFTPARYKQRANIRPKIICTTYEMIIRDTRYFRSIEWRYIVVDEGHRLRNLDTKLLKELRTIVSANRLIITGTPLQNNLRELWTLLNFCLPQLFDDLDSFQTLFNFDEVDENGEKDADKTAQLITTLHEILRPFLLRRLKADVAKTLPPKKEYVLYAPLTKKQKTVYDAILNRQIRSAILNIKTHGTLNAPQPKEDKEEEVLQPRTSRYRRTEGDTADQPKKDKAEGNNDNKIISIDDNDDEKIKKDISERDDDMDDDEFEQMIINEAAASALREKKASHHRRAMEAARTAARKEMGMMKFENLVMQARKICSHPYIFHWDLDENNERTIQKDLVNASGKLMLCMRLLEELIQRGHKTLIFSQFVSFLDILEDYLVDGLGWNICRLDGSTSQEEREEQIEFFNEKSDDPDAPKVFLLSTRAGGLGINLVGADSIIFYDSDWNPQVDIQAMDRVHRIGQTRPVLIFRLITQNTIEQRMMDVAKSKRKLESMVIAEGQFKQDKKSAKQDAATSKALATQARLEFALKELDISAVKTVADDEKVISDEELNNLLDRSDDAMKRKQGWTHSEGTSNVAQVMGISNDVNHDDNMKVNDLDDQSARESSDLPSYVASVDPSRAVSESDS
ncbi:hypothetical protein E3Q16_01818 [Wallemia mellicola]|uniref:Uncharacterized protein n=1 Tax=Wallemia mellicola TaxID=1708541 RepID=A0A4T0P693_9BASI|nr:hypothetical protein E3Q16_01818 [Wallemia mellicola]TIC17967.1 hypothetical protein E3Q15_00290 [Wallemia mellicola]TIC59516.1 hypothetical protein E3Q05_00083 [Wallemia mellicola]TIC67125.1 hypothetical protein E3Q01_01403 [Wallemia mellicola]